MNTPKVTRRKLADYHTHPSNPNRHTERGHQIVEDSVNYNGAGRSGLAAADGTLLAGNGTWEAMARAGIEEVIEVETDGHQWVIVKRNDLAPEDARSKALMISDNRASELGYDPAPDMLTALLKDIQAESEHLLRGAGFTEGELTALLRSLDTPAPDAGAQVDRAAELQQQFGTTAGQLWQLGKHRLAIGDCTDRAVVDALMQGERADMIWTDPPYGMNLDTDFDGMFSNDPSHRQTGARFNAVVGDDKDYDPRPLMDLFSYVDEQFWWGADYYLDKIPTVTKGSFIVWDKRCSEDMDKVVGNVFEIAWSKQKHRKQIARILWSGHHGMQHDDTDTQVHPTQKPVELARWFFDRWGEAGDIVVDLYLGSGTTLIASHNANRICYGCEIDPKYGAVIIQRWEALTGLQAERLADLGLTPARVE